MMSTDFGLVALTVFHARHACAALDFNVVLRTFSAAFDATGKKESAPKRPRRAFP